MNKVKLIIWDLDDTLWDGSIMVSKDVKLRTNLIDGIRELNKRGVVSSICSNNYHNFTQPLLEEFKMYELFIMPNINYEPKGLRIKSMIKDFQLRAENVFFIDDNLFNLKEVSHFNPGINVLNGSDINAVSNFLNETVSSNEIDDGKRFDRYKILETKVSIKNDYGSNEEFLADSNITVEIKQARQLDIDRVYELVHRTNQLNYTKNYKSKNELKEDILSHNSYIVKVADKYGYYGVVGFVSYTDTETIHFTFSCRILNMGVVDFVYHSFNFPPFDYKGEVAAKIQHSAPGWITRGIVEEKVESVPNKSLFMIGGCDLEQMVGYLKNHFNITTYFNYTVNGIPVHRDSIDFLKAPDLSEDDLLFILDTVPFVTKECYEKLRYDKQDIILYSPLIDYIQGKYQSTKIKDYYMSCHPFFHSKQTNKTIANFSVERRLPYSKLLKFSNNWKPVTKPLSVFKRQLNELIRDFSKNANQVIVMLGAETTYSDLDRDKLEKHHNYNELIKSVVNSYDNVSTMSPGQFINSRKDFTNNIRHYQRIVYQNLANKIIEDQTVNSKL